MASNDHWTLDLDHLGMKGAGEELARLILTCQPPYAICVQGKWGSGKTSLMRYAMAKLGGEPLGTTLKTSKDPIQELPDSLTGRWKTISAGADKFIKGSFADQCDDVNDMGNCPDPRVVPIWFNAWQHQDATTPLVALLQELRTQFTFLEQFGRFSGKLARVGVQTGLTILGDLVDTFAVLQGLGKTSLGQTPMNVMRIVEGQRRRDFDEIHDAQRLNLMFELAVKSLLEPVKSRDKEAPLGRDHFPLSFRRLVIFIDDLDRCSEQQTVRLLEAIKLYLQTRYCVFVVGMDSAAARRAVSNVLAHKGEEAQEYLEKLFQTSLQVPVPGDYTKFVGDLLEAADLTQKTTELSSDEIARRIVRLVEPNPRKLKNFVNTPSLGWAIRNRCKGPQVSFSLFLLLVFLRTYHPEAYRLLAYDPRHAQDLDAALTEGTKTSPSPVFLFFRQTFRHSYKAAFPLNVEGTRKDQDEVVTELIARLDRHKGDRAFRELWEEEFLDCDEMAVVPRVTAVLRSDQGPISKS